MAQSCPTPVINMVHLGMFWGSLHSKNWIAIRNIFGMFLYNVIIDVRYLNNGVDRWMNIGQGKYKNRDARNNLEGVSYLWQKRFKNGPELEELANDLIGPLLWWPYFFGFVLQRSIDSLFWNCSVVCISVPPDTKPNQPGTALTKKKNRVKKTENGKDSLRPNSPRADKSDASDNDMNGEADDVSCHPS